jgi:hypothetical protein
MTPGIQNRKEKINRKRINRTTRLFIGKSKEENVGLFINDEQGRPRIKIYVDKHGNPLIEFLDTKRKENAG